MSRNDMTVSQKSSTLDDQRAAGVRVGPEDCPSPHSWGNKAARVAWWCVWHSLFRFSPRIFYGWRRMLLRCFGAKVGRGAKVFATTRIWAPWNLTLDEYACLSQDVDCYCVAPVRIGAHATVSQGAFLCTASHDPEDPHMRLVTSPVTVAAQAWVCARAIVLPGITLAEGAIAGAGSVVTKDVPAWTIVAGNPAQPIGSRTLRSHSYSGNLNDRLCNSPP
jgi:putative colanic acid biosynthesis acetyltransferase WcaF